MKYYGSIYKGIVGKYDTKDLQGYDNPYDALIHANLSWDTDPELQIPRLLIVLEETNPLERDGIRREAYLPIRNRAEILRPMPNRLNGQR